MLTIFLIILCYNFYSGREISEQNNIKYSDTNSSERRYDTTETVVQMHLLEDAAANTPEMINSSDPGTSSTKKKKFLTRLRKERYYSEPLLVTEENTDK